MTQEPSFLTKRYWRVVPHADLHWRFWDDLYVVYNGTCGQTHVLDPLAALLVHQIAERPSETSELLQQFGNLLNLPVNEEFHSRIENMLSHLDDLGLIETTIA